MSSFTPSAPEPGEPASRPRDPAWAAEVEWDAELAPREVLSAAPRPVSSPEVVGEAPPPGKGLHGNRIPLERKSGDQLKQFTRLVSRPELAPSAPLERAVEGVTSVSREALQKRHPAEQAVYSVNRLQTVIDDVWTHSELTWLDQLGKVRRLLMWVGFVGVLGVLVLYFSREVRRQKVSDGPTAVAAAALPSDELRQAAVRRAFDAFLQAAGPAEKLTWVLDPQRVESRLKDYYEIRGEKDPAVLSYEVGRPLRAGGEWWFAISCVGADGSRFTAAAKETPAGAQVDWENFVAYGSLSWEAFLATRPAAPQSLRVQIRPSARYVGKYRAEEWSAYEIAQRSGKTSLLGYAPRASRTGQLLAGLAAGAGWQSANLYLRWEAEAGAPGCVVIAELIRSQGLELGSGAAGKSEAVWEPRPEAGKTPNQELQ